MFKPSLRRFNTSSFFAIFFLLISISSSTALTNLDTKEMKGRTSYFEKNFSSLEDYLTCVEMSSGEKYFSSKLLSKKTTEKEKNPALIDVAFMCVIESHLSQTSCVDNGGGSYTANFDLEIEWSGAPVSEDIIVRVGGTNIATIDPALNTSPQTIPFSLDADGTGQDTIIVFFETTTICADTSVIKSPSPCPPVTGGCTKTGNISLGLPTFAKEAPLGGISMTIPVELVEDFGGNLQTIGFNYDNVNIPSGATITSAFIQFEAASTTNESPMLTIKGEAVDDAAAYSTTPFDVTVRTLTADSVNWAPADWTVIGEMGPNQLTPDLSIIVQEIVDRPGWNANQNMAFIISGSGKRDAASQAILNVEFQYVGDCEATDACSTIGTDEVAGTAWNDFNYDGILNESTVNGFQGIQVQLYDCIGTLVATTFTNASGNYEFTGLSDQKYRVEFMLPEQLACWAKPTHAGSNNGTMVQFVEPGNCASLGLSSPADYCESNPLIGLTCFSEGPYDNVAISGDPAIITLPHDAEGHDFMGLAKTAGYQGNVLDTIGGLGAAYGLAWQATRKRMYFGAYHKRYSGFGVSGPDAIYQYDLAGNKTGTIELDALLGGTNTAGEDVHDFVTLNNGEVMDLGTGNASFDGVGKRSFGDLEMSDDMTTLYVVNLFDRKIYAIDVADGIAANASIVNSWDAPDPSGIGGHRPFALKWYQGKLWIGLVTEDGANAYVYSLDGLNGNFNLELTVPLTYERQSVIGNDANATTVDGDWNAWTSDPETTAYLADIDDIAYPQAMLTDIEFDGSAMILGFRDRFGDQGASASFFNNTDAAASDYTWPSTAGDILRACFNGFNYVLETGTSGACPTPSGLDDSGPNGVEHYHWDYYYFNPNWNPLNSGGGFHWETTQGALLQLANEPYIITTAMDPYSDYSGGILRLNNETGRREGILANDKSTFGDLIGGYTIYESGDFGATPPNNVNNTFGKANGLGDLEAFCEPAPIEIGNYVWCDSIRNGIQDACESGLDSVIVQLYDEDGLLIGQDTTDNGGYYYFNHLNVDSTGITVVTGAASPNNAWSGLNYATQYFLVFGDGQFATDEFTIDGLTYIISPVVDAGNNDNIDSDIDDGNLTSGSLGARPDGLPFIDLTTTPTGCGDHKYDLGLFCNIIYDYGDLPDMADGTTGIRDYETYDSTGGPSHEVIVGLFLGDTVDIDIDGVPDTLAVGDDNKDGVDDEDGVTIFPSLNVSPGGIMKLPLSVTNTTGNIAYLEAWIDWNGDGKFDGPNEMVVDYVDAADGNFPVSMDITVPSDALTGNLLGFRVRLSNTDNMTPYGRVNSGEVEDYLIGIDCPQMTCLPAQIELKKQ